jgi:hypothetical protein
MLLVLAVGLLAAAGWRADALSATVTVTDTKCIHEFVPYEGGSVFGYFVIYNDISWSSDQSGIYLTVLAPFFPLPLTFFLRI